MQGDSLRCDSGNEITTYDSLDASLGPALQNLYLEVKCWAAYWGLNSVFDVSGNTYTNFADLAKTYEQGDRCAKSALAHERPDRVLAASSDPNRPTWNSRVLSAIEALVYKPLWNEWFHQRNPGSEVTSNREGVMKYAGGYYSESSGFGGLFMALRTHTTILLSDPERRNKFPDNGIRLSSTSDNSWISKIALVQHVARELFNLNEDGQERKYKGDASGWEKSDAAHVKWQTEGTSPYWACSDQFVNGAATGSRYYPRLITATLWLRDTPPASYAIGGGFAGSGGGSK